MPNPKTKTTTNAPSPKPDAERIWKLLEDDLAPRLRLTLVDRAVYSHLLRHSRLEGHRQLRFSIHELSRRVRLSCTPVRDSIRRLEVHGILRLLQRNNAGHVADVRLPEEVCSPAAAGPARFDAVPAGTRRLRLRLRSASRCALDQIDFLKRRELRRAIHARERGSCFYCLRRLAPAGKCLDHVIPRALSGRNSYCNLVSCCSECNAQKGRRQAADFLRCLYREQRLTASELKNRFAALKDLAAGKLLPALP